MYADDGAAIVVVSSGDRMDHLVVLVWHGRRGMRLRIDTSVAAIIAGVATLHLAIRRQQRLDVR